MRRVPVGRKLLLLALLPACCVFALVVVAALSDYRTGQRLSIYRAQTRLSYVLEALATDLDHERRAAALTRLNPGMASDTSLAGYERATTQAFARARARALHVAAPVDVVGDLDAARTQRRALVLQLHARALAPARSISGYSVIEQNVLGLAATLDAGAPSPSSARAADAYGAIVQAIEAASRERVFVATLLARRERQPATTDPWGGTEAVDLGSFRENAAGPLVSDLQGVLFSQAGLAVQRFRDALNADPAAAVRSVPLQRWLSNTGTRIDALRALATTTAGSLDGLVSDELDSAHANAARDLALSLAFLVLVTALALALRRSITGPLREVSAAAHGLAHGDLTAGVEYSSRDEIGDVAAAFRDMHATAERLVDEIRAKNDAVRENRLDHRAEVGELEGVWSQLLAGMNDNMAAFAEIQERREHAERETARVFEMSLDLLCVIGFDGYFKRINPAFERTLGYSRKVLLSRRGFDFTHHDDIERSLEAFSRLREGEQVERFENRNVCADGSFRWLEWNARAVPEEELVYAVARDITDSRRAAEEQAALRRVATLVARAVAPEDVFASVAEEAGRLMSTDIALIARYGAGPSATGIVGWRRDNEPIPLGTEIKLGGHNVASVVFRTGRPARVDSYEEASGEVAGWAHGIGIRSSVGVPITVEGRLWGVMTVSSETDDRLPPGTEDRLSGFTDLVATAIANAEAREELAASRARLVTSADEARRRIVRDLHDAAQQRLVHTIITLKLAQRAHEAGDGQAAGALVKEGLEHAERANSELRELVYGILPSALNRGGLTAGVAELTARLRVPVEVEVATDRFSAALEATAYFVIAEALTNVAKHSGARQAKVCAEVVDGTLRIAVRDDGIGGARADGSGLRGLADRVGALGGQLRIESPVGGGTLVTATLPLTG